ncbi:hypothetical protein [Methylobacterium sp. SI9]|uniref:hypothetical protein n=1 Tax=Methylobacterium guangdongense TaxID=3138811 RepID=UPI00313AC5EA
MASDATSDTLQRVAHALGVPVDAFFDPSAKCQIGSAAQALQDRMDLLEIFAQIEDPSVQRECIEFVRAKALRPSRPISMPLLAD